MNYVKVLSRNLLAWTEGNLSFSTVDVPVEDRVGHLPITSRKF